MLHYYTSVAWGALQYALSRINHEVLPDEMQAAIEKKVEGTYKDWLMDFNATVLDLFMDLRADEQIESKGLSWNIPMRIFNSQIASIVQGAIDLRLLQERPSNSLLGPLQVCNAGETPQSTLEAIYQNMTLIIELF